jgi:hypothetical protein
VGATSATPSVSASGYYTQQVAWPKAVTTDGATKAGTLTASLSVIPSSSDTTTTGTTTTNNADGSTTSTTTNADGSTSQTTTSADGNTVSTTQTDANGNVVSKTETVTENFDNTIVVTETVTDAEGNKTVTETASDEEKTVVSVTKPDGSQTMDVQGANGVTVAIEANAQNEITKFDVTIPEYTDADADAVTLPVSITNLDLSYSGEISINMTVQSETAKVEVPVELDSNAADNALDNLVAVLVKEDGTEEIIKLVGTTDAGLLLNLEGGSNQIKLIDNTKTFDDVSTDGSNWYGDAVSFVSSHEIMNGDGGKGATSFAPDIELSRGMMAQILFNLDNADAGDIPTPDAFADASGAWYNEAASWALGREITTGYEDGTFGGDDLITREQAITMLYRYAGTPESDANTLNGFADASGVSDFAKDAMAWATEAGIITGKGGTSIAAGDTATRAEIAVMAKRFCNYIAQQ